MSYFDPTPLLGHDEIPVPTCPEQAAETLRKLAMSSRRSFLGRGLAAAAVPATLVAASSTGQAAGTTNNGPFPSYYAGSTIRNFQEIQADEASHVNILIAAIRSLGGTPRPYPTFQGISFTKTSASQFLSAAVGFENTGVHAYFGAAPYIMNPNVAGVTTSIALVEAYHSGFLNSLSNNPLVPGGVTYATPYTIPEVLAAASPFIASLNDNGMFPATFSTTPSPENDIAILNFALLLEYLEATFYYNSVSKVFS